MNLGDLARLDAIETLHTEYDETRVVNDAYTSDLLSDVMANAKESGILITIQSHNNTIAVASLAGVAGILVCNNRPVPEDMIETARRERIAVFRTALNQFQGSCLVGRLLADDQARAS